MPTGLLTYIVGQRSPTVKNRIISFIESFKDDKLSFQVEQSYIAIKSGGIIGRGAGESRQKESLPYCHSDFIFSILIEEYGLLGGTIVIFAYLIILYCAFKISRKSTKVNASILAMALAIFIVMQAFVHIGVCVGLLPVTGLNLPMLSLGGSSLITTGIAMGMIMSIDKYSVPLRKMDN